MSITTLIKSIVISVTLVFLMSGCATQLRDMLIQHGKNAEKERIAKEEKEKADRDPLYAQQLKQQKEEIAGDISSGKRSLDAEPILKQLKGEYKGSVCNGKTPVEIEITEAVKLDEETRALGYGYKTQPGLVIYLYGNLRMTDPQGKKIATNLRGTLNLFGGLLSLHSMTQPTMKDYIADVMVTSTQEKGLSVMPPGYLILERAKADVSKLSIYEQKYGTQAQSGGGKPPSPMIPIEINLARDSQGKGWQGSFEAEGFSGCEELSMVSVNGNSTSIFPPVTRKLAVRYGSGTQSLMNQIYWLKVIEKIDNDDEVALAIASTYEEMGAKSPQYYQKAVQYYRQNADKIGDVRAQTALARLYREGNGVPKDPVQAAKWQKLADHTNKTSAEICASPTTVKAMYSIMAYIEQKVRAMAFGVSIATGVNANPGKVKLEKISPDKVITLDKPFTCQVIGKYIDPKFDADSVPEYVYAGKDINGVDYYHDNRGDKAVKQMIAGAMEKLAKVFPYHDSFKIVPMGNQKYKINVDQEPGYQFEIDLQGKGSIVPFNQFASLASSTHQYAYIANYSVSQYTILSNGNLAPMNPPWVAAGSDARSIVVDRSGKHAYAANYGSNDISQYTIGVDGKLAPMTAAKVATGTSPNSIVVDPSGKYVYVANMKSNNVSQYTIGADGHLTPMTTASVAAGTAPWSITVDPKGKYVYVANANSYNISQYRIGAGGNLVPMSPATVATKGFFNGPLAIIVDPNGKYVYTANNRNNVAQFTIGADGTLEPMSPATVEVGDFPLAITVDPSGKYVYVANQNSNNVSQFTIGADGRLAPMSPATIVAGRTPISIAVDRSGKYAYVGNSGAGGSQFTIGADGRLTPNVPDRFGSFRDARFITTTGSGQ